MPSGNRLTSATDSRGTRATTYQTSPPHPDLPGAKEVIHRAMPWWNPLSPAFVLPMNPEVGEEEVHFCHNFY